MRRRPILVLLAGVLMQFAGLLGGSPLFAQMNMSSGIPLGPGSGDDNFSNVANDPKPEVHVLTSDHAPGEVHGVIRYSTGLPMVGAQVVILSAEADVDRSTVSAEDGSYSFNKLKPGNYQLTARLEGFAPLTRNVVVVPGKAVNFDVAFGFKGTSVMPAYNSAAAYRGISTTHRSEASSLRLNDSPAVGRPKGADSSAASTATTASVRAPEPEKVAAAAPVSEPIPAAVAEELAAMRKRYDDLEARFEALAAELKARDAAQEQTLSASAAPAAAPVAPQDSAAASQAAAPKLEAGQFLSTAGTPTYYKGDTDIPSHPDGWEPFSYADWTWMNANGRQHDSPWSTKYFTPEFRADVNYMDSFNHPRDNSLGGSTESFRSNEWQLEQLSLGGDIRIGHIRGRILTMFGMFATTTPRNDGSTSRGQWDLRNDYRYISEGWGGYHFDNIGHGLNIDAGIFVSYIGLFSYYNFDNWTYQPSFVSSNTPWFFNGVRIQYFPTAKLKIEPWIINGWQSYARFNSKPGLGGQILWRPKPWLSFVFNNYGMGTDVLGFPGASRVHTDDSVEIREYNHPEKFLDMMAMSFTADAGCQYGGTPNTQRQNCFNDKNGGLKTSFLGWMLYQRFQFAHDHYGITVGGGQMNNRGRYLTLLPPINGADAISGSPYFTENPGDKAHMYDATFTADYMPSQWLTFRWEYGYRHADIPYWSGRGGITPPNGVNAFLNTGSPASYVCTNGVFSIVSTFPTSGNGFTADNMLGSTGGGASNTHGAIDRACNTQSAGYYAWAPDLRKSQSVVTFAIMTRF